MVNKLKICKLKRDLMILRILMDLLEVESSCITKMVKDNKIRFISGKNQFVVEPYYKCTAANTIKYDENGAMTY